MKQPLILIAEDDVLSHKMLDIILSKRGYNIIYAANGREALQAYDQQRPDLVILDIQMPILDGIETCKQLRARDAGPTRIPILALTASPQRLDSTGPQPGALFDGFIGKPFEIAHLLEMIESRLSAATQTNQRSQPIEPTSPPTLDLSGALTNLGNDLDAYKDIFTEFIHSLHERMIAMRNDLETNNMDGLSTKAHNLKGISANLGALALSSLSARLDEESENRQEQAARETLHAIEAHVKTLVQQAESLLHENILVR